jgi:hypothetical protein
MSAAHQSSCFDDLEALQFFTSPHPATDRRGNRIIRIVGKYFPGSLPPQLDHDFDAFFNFYFSELSWLFSLPGSLIICSNARFHALFQFVCFPSFDLFSAFLLLALYISFEK